MFGAPLMPGTPAPEFKANDHLGNEVSLDSLKGRYAVLVFYPADGTPT